MGKFYRSLSCMALALLLIAPTVQAKILGIFDLDGTVFKDQGNGAAWRTPWLLKRIDEMHSLFQQAPNGNIEVILTEPEQIAYYNAKTGKENPLDVPLKAQIQLPEQIAISYDEYRRLQKEWAKAETIAGSLRPVLLAADPLRPKRERLIIPGYYKTFDLTFKYYRESTGTAKKSYIVNDYLEAKQRAALLGPGADWKGPAFALLQAFMANRSSVRNAQFSTARGHRPEEYWALGDRMVAEGDLQNFKSENGERPHTHSLNQPDSRLYGPSLVDRKTAVPIAAAQALFRTSGARHRELHPDGELAARGEMFEGHTQIVAEDEPTYVNAIAEDMLNLSGNYFSPKVKFVLFNCSTDDELAHAKFPWRWTVFYNRKARPATAEEIQFWLDPKSHRESCEDLLVKEGV